MLEPGKCCVKPVETDQCTLLGIVRSGVAGMEWHWPFDSGKVLAVTSKQGSAKRSASPGINTDPEEGYNSARDTSSIWTV
jgi:hypothetical protein